MNNNFYFLKMKNNLRRKKPGQLFNDNAVFYFPPYNNSSAC